MNTSEAMQRAFYSAMFSIDPSTQNGAVSLEHGIGAYNSFPHLVAETPGRLERPLKYQFIEHAERNLIYSCARQGFPLDGTTMVAVWAACADCARAIVQSGITKLIRIPIEPHGAWAESIAIGDTILEEGGVTVVEYDIMYSMIMIPDLLRDGKPWNPRKS